MKSFSRLLPICLLLCSTAFAATPYDEAVALGLPALKRQDFKAGACNPDGEGGQICSLRDAQPALPVLTIGYDKAGVVQSYTAMFIKPAWKDLERRYGKGDPEETPGNKSGIPKMLTNEWERGGVTISAWERGKDFFVIFMPTPK